MPYMTSQELDDLIKIANQQFAQIKQGIGKDDSPYSNGEVVAYYHDVFFAMPNFSPEKKNLVYAYLNFCFYQRSKDEAFFNEARKHFEKVTVDYQAQAQFFLGALWEQAYKHKHSHLSRHFERDPRQLALKHFQQVQLPTQNPDQASDQIAIFMESRKRIALILLGHKKSFPGWEGVFQKPGIFKPDHLRSIVAIIEMFQTHIKFGHKIQSSPDFKDIPTKEDLLPILSQYCNIRSLENGHLVFLEEGDKILTPDQQYKIARTCFDRNMINEENFHTILRRIHHTIKISRFNHDRQLLRKVKFYLAKLSLQLYYKSNDRDNKLRYSEDLSGFYNDWILTDSQHYRETIAKRNPKTLATVRLIRDLLIDGDQKIPYSDPLTHGYEVTTPFIHLFSTTLSFILGVAGTLVDIIPRIIVGAVLVAWQIIVMPFTIVIGSPLAIIGALTQRPTRGDIDTGFRSAHIIFPLLLLPKLLKVYRFVENSGHWGQTIGHYWSDTGFTFIFRKIGEYTGNVIGFFLGLTLSIITYFPRLFFQGFINLIGKGRSETLKPSDMQTILNDNKISLEIEKAPLDYLREEKCYSNYRNPKLDPIVTFKYRFQLFSVNAIESRATLNFRHFATLSQSSSESGNSPSAPQVSLKDTYHDYVATAPALSTTRKCR